MLRTKIGTMGRKIIVSACALNQWSLDFAGNKNRILKSIHEAKSNGSKLYVSSELAISGYGCQDHFLESDTFLHSWEVLAKILTDANARDILLLVGMPVMHKNTGYNCVVFVLNGKILLIRPKQTMCDSANYRESRWFAPWRKLRTTEDYYLPRMIRTATGQETVPFGDAVIATRDTCIGCETCEELWTANSPHVWMSQDGVEIFCNQSGSHHELRKSAYQLNMLIKAATDKVGGVYVFSNQRGCDGDRLYYDGNPTVAVNEKIVARGEQFSLAEIEVVSACIDIEDVRSYRNRLRSNRLEAASAPSYPRINVDFCLTTEMGLYLAHSEPVVPRLPTPEEEIANGPSCWLWDYLRSSKQGGFFLPLSGGRDSASVACMVYSMAVLVCNAVKKGDSQVAEDVRRIASKEGEEAYTPSDPQELCGRLLFTCYMGTENSSVETKERAAALAQQIGSQHSSIVIDAAVSAIMGIFKAATGLLPKFRAHGGTQCENLALQNVQARLRMVLSYLFAQLSLWARERSGGLLVLATANVDEGLRGYLTKYDCSSGDINPIGSISKRDLDAFLRFSMSHFGLDSLKDILEASPTAELEPLQEGKLVQTDEVDMGMTYDELSTFGRLRRPDGCGPYSMFCKLLHQWGDRHTPEEIAQKVKHFFRCYAINRHKATVSTPAYHAEVYSPDDHRHDHRPFLYNVQWTWQFAQIDLKLKEMREGECKT